MLKFEQHITITDTDTSIVNNLSTACSEQNLSVAAIKSAIDKGALWLTRDNYTQRIRKIKKVLKVNDVLHFYYDKNVLEQNSPEAQLIADCEQYSVWYKPYGMLSQGSKWSDHCTITRWSEKKLLPQRPAFLVHRLDRAASGLIIIAHSKKVAKKLSHMFEQRTLDKRYHIIVHGSLSDEFDRNHGLEVNTNIDNKAAKSTFYPLEKSPLINTSLIEVKIDTGRKHQIRIHAASIGHPIVGDRLHGNKELDSTGVNLQLCAMNLEFICPVKEEYVTYALPEALRLNLNTLVEN